jgi:hypothetical protein
VLETTKFVSQTINFSFGEESRKSRKCLKLFLKHTYIADSELKGLEFESRIRRWVIYMLVIVDVEVSIEVGVY